MSEVTIKIPGYTSDKAYARLEPGKWEKYVRVEGDKFKSTEEVWTTIPQEEMMKRLADAKANPEADKLDPTEDMLYDTEEVRLVFIRKTGTINDIHSVPTVTLGPPNCS